MLGYDLKISELKLQLDRDPVTAEKVFGRQQSASWLRSTLEGKELSYSPKVSPWGSPVGLLNVVEQGDGGEALLYDGGYPFLMLARGRTIISELADVERSNQLELKELLDLESLYLVEVWDQS